MNPIDGPVVTWDDGEESGIFDAVTHKRIRTQKVACLGCGDEATYEDVMAADGYWSCLCGHTQVLA